MDYPGVCAGVVAALHVEGSDLLRYHGHVLERHRHRDHLHVQGQLHRVKEAGGSESGHLLLGLLLQGAPERFAPHVLARRLRHPSACPHVSLRDRRGFRVCQKDGREGVSKRERDPSVDHRHLHGDLQGHTPADIAEPVHDLLAASSSRHHHDDISCSRERECHGVRPAQRPDEGAGLPTDDQQRRVHHVR
eukprot:768066-Hanusia_phi.AAC.7